MNWRLGWRWLGCLLDCRRVGVASSLHLAPSVPPLDGAVDAALKQAGFQRLELADLTSGDAQDLAKLRFADGNESVPQKDVYTLAT